MGRTDPTTGLAIWNASQEANPTDSDGMGRTRSGQRFRFGPQNGIVGVAPVQDIPTNVAQWVLWNPSTPPTSIIVDSLGVLLVAGVAAAGIVVVVAPVSAPAQISPSFTGIAMHSASRAAAAGSSLIVKSNVTITTPSPPCWYPIAKSDSANTGVVSVAGVNADVRGRIIIPPGEGLAIAVLSGLGVLAKFAPFGDYVETLTDLG